MAAALLSACAAADAGPIRIGVAGSFSDPIGLPMKLAAELAAEEINAAGGIGGRRLELVTRDDYADPDSAVFVANDLYHSDVAAVVGHLFSGTTLAASPVYNGGNDPVAAVLVVEVEHGAPLEPQALTSPAGQGCTMGEVARADAERVLPGAGDLR